VKVVDLIRTYKGVLFGKPDYWHPLFKANEYLDNKLQGKYYLDMSSKADYPGKLDENNVPLLVLDQKNYHSPVTIAQYALGNYDKYQATGDNRFLENFFCAANWFATNCMTINSSCVWYSYFENRLYSLKVPWASALSQGQGISVLARAYIISKQPRYLNIALRAAKLFEVPVNKGGVKTLIEKKHVFYEEYPSDEASLVLNGFIFSLWGLYDLYLVTKEKVILHLYEEGLKTLITILPKYDFFGWSRYDLYSFSIPNVTSIFYHRLHIEQLKVMYQLTGNQIFQKYLTIWSKGERNLSITILSQIVKMLQKLSVRKLCTSVYR
jgi:hypothetical protein